MDPEIRAEKRLKIIGHREVEEQVGGRAKFLGLLNEQCLREENRISEAKKRGWVHHFRLRVLS